MRQAKVSRKTVFALVFYIVIPSAAILATMTNYPELSRSGLVRILASIIPIGFALVAMTQYQERFAKGTKQHLYLDLAYTVTALLWVFALLGGSPSITQTWNGYEFTIHIWKKLVIVIAVAVVNVAYYALVHLAYRDEAAEDGMTTMDDISESGETGGEAVSAPA